MKMVFVVSAAVLMAGCKDNTAEQQKQAQQMSAASAYKDLAAIATEPLKSAAPAASSAPRDGGR